MLLIILHRHYRPWTYKSFQKILPRYTANCFCRFQGKTLLGEHFILHTQHKVPALVSFSSYAAANVVLKERNKLQHYLILYFPQLSSLLSNVHKLKYWPLNQNKLDVVFREKKRPPHQPQHIFLFGKIAKSWNSSNSICTDLIGNWSVEVIFFILN